MTMITPSYLGDTIEYSSLHACRSTLEDPTAVQEFVTFYLRRSDLVEAAKYIPMTNFQQRKEQIKLEKALASK